MPCGLLVDVYPNLVKTTKQACALVHSMFSRHKTAHSSKRPCCSKTSTFHGYRDVPTQRALRHWGPELAKMAPACIVASIALKVGAIGVNATSSSTSAHDEQRWPHMIKQLSFLEGAPTD